MTEQTPEATAPVDPSASVAADTTATADVWSDTAPASSPAPSEVAAPVDPSATVSADAGTPVSATEPAATPAATPEPTPAPAASSSDAAPVVDAPASDTPAATTPVAPTEPVLQGGPNDPTTDVNGETVDPAPVASTVVDGNGVPVLPENTDPQETKTVVLDETGSDGAFIHGNLVIGTQPVDVFAGDIESIFLAAAQQGRKVKLVEIEVD